MSASWSCKYTEAGTSETGERSVCTDESCEVKSFGECQQHIFNSGDVRVLELQVYRGWHFRDGGEKIAFMEAEDVFALDHGGNPGCNLSSCAFLTARCTDVRRLCVCMVSAVAGIQREQSLIDVVCDMTASGGWRVASPAASPAYNPPPPAPPACAWKQYTYVDADGRRPPGWTTKNRLDVVNTRMPH